MIRLFEKYYENLNPELKAYYEILCPVFPRFLIPFIETKTMMRLKDVGYFCGMDYGNEEIYDFKFYLSTLDHSISTALMVYGKTFNEIEALAALFHDAGSPALRHVIDYLNNDHIHQESTEIDLIEVFKKDEELLRLIKLHNYNIEDIANCKKYPLVDSARPMLCADRLDGIFLNSLVWSQSLTVEEIAYLYDNIIVVKNELGQDEYSFIEIEEADILVELNDEIDYLTQSEEDYFSFVYLAKIIKCLIDKQIIKYEDLYILTDVNIFDIIYNNLDEKEIKELYDIFMNLDIESNIIRFPIKKRKIDPLILKLRYSDY